MGYIGHDLQVAYQSYLTIDDISGSFNGSTTSFALLVNGAAPVPLPLRSNQCLISVGGVVQRPDDSGAEGFRLSGGNIIFSSAPSTGEDFFGVILAGADYVGAGTNFPDGTVGAPSITFDLDNDTGYYRSGSGSVGFASNGVASGSWSSAGVTAPALIPTGSTVPANGTFLPTTNTLGFSTNTTERVRIDSSGRVGIGTTSPAYSVHVAGTVGSGSDIGYRVQDTTNSKIVQIMRTGSSYSYIGIGATEGALYSDTALSLAADNSNPIKFCSGGSERARIDSSGRLLVGTTSSVSTGGLFQVVGGDAARPVVHRNINDQYPPVIYLSKARGTGNQSVSNGDIVGYFGFIGADGTNMVECATIQAIIDGNPGASDMPGRLVFSTTADGASSPTEAMRITSARTVEFVAAGGTSGKPAGVIAPIGYVGRSGTSGSFANVFNIYWNGSAARLWIDTSDLGSITTSSDYRIKQNVQTQTQPAIERIKLLRPVTYELKDYGELFKADGITREGFIAHEVQEVIPSGAEGVKDEEDRIQNLRVDAIVSVLTKAFQEAIAKIETLEAEVAALKAS